MYFDFYLINHFCCRKRKSEISTPSTSKSCDNNIFGLNKRGACQDEPNDSRITSTFVLRIANGNERRVAELQGEYVVDLKVYRTSDIKELDSLEAWKKALVRIKLQTSENTDQWRSLQRLINHADEVFEEEPRFYKDKK